MSPVRASRLDLSVCRAIAMIALVALGACSKASDPGPTICSASSCEGCCMGNKCITVTDTMACGAGGSSCQTCRANETCTGGDCVLKACAGCVDPVSFACVMGNTATQCGSAGGVCSKCGTGTACTDGVCKSTACTGCIDAAGGANSCKPGTTDTLCGGSGGACMACTGGQKCVDHHCAAPPGCGPATCAGGCCDSTDSCQTPGDTASACGSAGGACATCSGTATCVNRECVTPCGPGNAAGCCDDTGTEQPSTVAHCGNAGVTCVACKADEICSSGTCISTTCSATCATCCVAGACKLGNVATECGKGGNACVACGAGQTCSNNTCIVDPKSKWALQLVSGELPFWDTTGKIWDTVGAYPDGYVYAILDYGGTATQDATSPTISDTISPNWNNHPLFSGVTAELLQKTTYIYVRDSDPVGYDDMGLCSIAIGQSMFNGVPVVFTCGLGASETPNANRMFKWKLTFKLVQVP